MIKILFVCHGNICRSPMAEFIFKKMAADAGLAERFEVASAATSREEIGNDVYPPAKQVLSAHGVPFEHRAARQLTREDYDRYDHVVAMEDFNLRNIGRAFGIEYAEKTELLMDYTRRPGNVSDPWYTHDFDTAYRDVEEGCAGMLTALKDKAK